METRLKYSVPVIDSQRVKRLHVCIVSSVSCHATGGIASYIRLLAQHLVPDCAVSAVSRFEMNQIGTMQYAGTEGARILNNPTIETHLIAPVPAFRPLLKQLHHFTSRRKWRNIAVRSFVRAYASSMRQAIPEDADVIHYVGTGWELLGYAALAEARRRNIGFTLLPAVHPGSWGDGELDVQLYNEADAVITLSNYERKHLIKQGVQHPNLYTLGLGPASEMKGDGQSFRNEYSLGARPLVLFIGRKERGKGYHALLQAMSIILLHVPDACLVAIGPDREPPYPTVSQNSMRDLGQADEQTKANALAACDVFCMPSLHESFGIVYVEAWSYSKPVVGSVAPAIRELISDDVNGYIVEQNSEQIALVLTRLLSDPVLAQRLGKAGHELQKDCYNWNIVSNSHKHIFQNIL